MYVRFTLLILLLTNFTVQAQTKVSGLVRSSDDNEPLIGVTVAVKGKNSGAVTGVDGTFNLMADPAKDVLVFNYTGYATQELALGGVTDVSVVLATSSEFLNEVIVVAFGESTREKFTGSAATVGADQIARRPITNLAQAIAGAGSGVQATFGSGQPGAAPDIRIRGFGSISSGSDPLYVVDGIPFAGDISNISPDDIESISVLKDAASTSLYGSRAANGVVMVTTKKGQKGRSSITLKYTQGNSQRGLPEYDRVEIADYYPLMWEAYRNSLMSRATNPLSREAASADASRNIVSLLGYNAYNVPAAELVGTDGRLNSNAQVIFKPEDLNWETPLMRQGVRNEVNLSFQGGDGKTDYFASFGYLNDKGFLIRSDFKRYNARVQINNTLKPWLKTNTNLSYTNVFSNISDAGTGNNTAFVNPFFFSRNMGPIYPVYAYDPRNPGQYLLDANGNRQYDFGNLNALGLPNRPQYGGRHAIAETELNQNFFRRNFFSGRTFVEASFLKDFRFRASVGADYTNRSNNTYGNPVVGDGAPAGRATNELNNTISLNLGQQLIYKKVVGAHTFDALLGHENFRYQYSELTGSRSQQILEGNIELGNFTTTTNLNSFADNYRTEGYFSRINYDYDDRYFVTASARRDGTSKFAKDSRWGNFFGASAAWLVTNESFMKGNKLFTYLKLRSSYGQTGNDGFLSTAAGNGISFYAWQPRYNLGFNNAGEPGIIQGSLGNLLLEWETNTQMDAALEFGILKDRISGTFEFFNRASSNLLFDVPLPLSTGNTTQTRNIGSMYNRGYEMELRLVPVKTKSFSWAITLNATTFKNRITKMPAETPEVIDGTKKLRVGTSIYDYWLRDWYGVNPANGDGEYRATALVATNTRITETGDTVTTSQNNARFAYHGSAIPDLVGAFTNEISYKGFTLSAQFIYQVGGKIYEGSYAALMASAGYGAAKHVDILKRWQNPGDITSVPRADVARSVDFNAASSRWLIDGSSINLRNINLSYTLPSKFAKRMRIENLQVYASGENLALWNRRKGMNVFGNFNGVTGNTYSFYRNFVGGLSLTF
jgi:TonB-linked SusC/RagA family outer membrane protein